MTIIRAPRPERNFSIINNEIIRNQQLTYRARGILAFLLSQPDHWRTNTDRLAYPGTEGRDAIRSAMNELQLAGYVVLVKRQRANGQWLSEWLVYDEPAQNRSVDDLWISATNSQPPKPEKPTPDNQALKERLNINIDAKKSETLLETMRTALCTTCNGSGKNASTTNKGYLIKACGTCKGAGTQ